MIKHLENTPQCPSCEAKLLTAHPDLVEWFHVRVKPNFPTFHISWAWRGKEDQEKFVTEKRSKLHYPFSPHNKCDDRGKPCSMALDLFEQVGGKDFYPISMYHRIQELIEEHNDHIEWGGRWHTIGDSDHFQLELG